MLKGISWSCKACCNRFFSRTHFPACLCDPPTQNKSELLTMSGKICSVSCCIHEEKNVKKKLGILQLNAVVCSLFRTSSRRDD